MTTHDTPPPNIDQQLLPRLRFMGWLLGFFSGCALIYGLFFTIEIPPEIAEALATDELLTPAEMQRSSGFADDHLFEINSSAAYAVAICFALVGGICFLIAWKKEKDLHGNRS